MGVEAEMDAGTDAEGAEGTAESLDESIMREMDEDKDGFLSFEEFFSVEEALSAEEKEVFTNAFNIADADKDGKLSVDEIPEAIKQFENMNAEENPEDDATKEDL